MESVCFKLFCTSGLKGVIMRKRTAFTLIELLVVIAIIALLMSILMPVLADARRQAKDSACLLTLKQWSLVFQMYADDNDGSTISDPPWGDPGIPGPESWIGTLYHRYYKDKKLLLCPAAVKPDFESSEWGKKDWAWYLDHERTELPPPSFDLEGPPFPGVIGSYGINDWCYNGPAAAANTWGYLVEWCWRSYLVDGAYNIPIFADCLHIGAFPMEFDDPPQLEDMPWTSMNGEAGMARVCINRHGKGAANILFMDLSARAVGLKELWTLKWNRVFNVDGPWTIAGFGGSKEACAAAWDAQSDWLRHFPEF